MRWSCPHCGVTLAINEDKMGAGWSFSRCYKCGGHALVRRTEVNVIRVDKAPPGEQVLLPEGAELLSEGALQNLAARKPVVKPAGRSSAADTAAALLAQAAAAQSPSANTQPAYSGAQPSHADLSRAPSVAAPPPVPVAARVAAGFPAPLPEVASTARARYMPLAIGAAGAIAVVSGFYLYLQAQQLWGRAHAVAALDAQDPPALQAATAATQAPPAQTQAQAPVQTAANTAQAPEVVDQVRHNAMAPVRPEREATPPRTEGRVLLRLRGEQAKIHGGPGLAFPVIAIAAPENRYPVIDWKDRWFKVELPGRASGWIRNDMVRIESFP